MLPTQPPRAAVRLLERRLPDYERDELIGDLAEDFRQRVAGRGRWRARVWYWRQALALVAQRRRREHAMAGPASPRLGLFADSATDWRLAWRSLRRSPGFSLVAVASIVLSLGLATAVFSIVRTVLLHPVPFSTADRIVRLGAMVPGGDFGRQARPMSVGAPPPPPTLSDVLVGAWLARRRALGPMATYRVERQGAELDGESMRVSVASVGPEFFDVLPVRPRAGRTTGGIDADRSAPTVALVSERLTLQRWGDPAAILGRTIALNDRPHEVVGVLPADFDWPDRHTEVWTVDRTVWPEPGAARNVGRTPTALARLQPGATIEDARREGQALADEVSAFAADPRSFGGTPTVSVTRVVDELLAPIRPALTLLTFGLVGVVVAANVNLAGFLLARHTARRRDLAVRRALGASGWRLVRPLLFEQTLLAGAGAVGAVLLGWWVLRALPFVAPPDLPRLSDVGLDGPSFLFAWLSAALTALIVGLMPARRLPAASLRALAAEGGASVSGTSRRAERSRSGLVIVQVAMATLLLVGSVLVGRSLLSMLRIDVGYEPKGVLTFQLGTTPFRADPQPGRLWDFYSTLTARLRAHPSVVAVGKTDALPLHGDTLRSTLIVPGLTPPRVPGVTPPSTHMESVDAGYLPALGARLVEGRFFTDEDALGAEPVAIVNTAFASTFMPGVDPLGQVVPRGVSRLRVVGVIEPIQRAASTSPDDAALYSLLTLRHEFLLSANSAMGIAVRTSGDPAALMPVVRALVRELDSDVPVLNMMPLSARVNRTFAQPRFFAIALALFAALALATALVGVYGVLAASVERRRLELGVRRALGAGTGDLVRLVLRRALALAVAGLAIGSVLAAAAAVAGRSALYGVEPVDAASYTLTMTVVVMAVLAGAWVPIRRALGVDPAQVLRTE